MVTVPKAKPRETPGQALQKLVETIERVVNARPEIRIESPKRLRDKDTGRWREHDVVLTFKFEHHEMVTALECKDRSRKIGVPDVEAFRAKCLRTGIDRGIMVSSLGFTKSAIEKANAQNIGCLTLSEAPGFDWCMMPGVECHTANLQHTHLMVDADGEQGKPYRLFENDGSEVDQAALQRIGLHLLAQVSAEKKQAAGEALMRDTAPTFHLMDDAGNRIPVRSITAKITWDVQHELVPLQFREYFDAAGGRRLYTAATAEINLGAVKGRFVMVNKEGEGIAVSFVPEKPALPKPQK